MTTTTRTDTDAAWRRDIDDAPVTLAATGGLVAVGGAGGTAWVLNGSDGRPTTTLTMPGGLLDLTFSPDGARLALTGPLGYAVWEAATGHIEVIDTTRWSARARWATRDRVAVADGRTAVVLDADGRELWRTAPAPSTITDLAARRPPPRPHRLQRRTMLRTPPARPGRHLHLHRLTPGHRRITQRPLDLHRKPGRLHPHLAHPRRHRTHHVRLPRQGLPAGLRRHRTLAGRRRRTRSHRLGLRRQRPPRHQPTHVPRPRPDHRPRLETRRHRRPGHRRRRRNGRALERRNRRTRTTATRWELGDQVTALAWNGRGTLLAATRDGTVHYLTSST
jgi:hypothetical protein